MPDLGELPFEDRLSLLLERQKTDREQRRYQRLKGQRQAPPRRDYRRPQLQGAPRPRSLPRAPASPPDSGSGTARTVLVTGATGSGKSYLACALEPPSLPQRHLDPLLPPLPAPGRTHPRPEPTAPTPSSSSTSPEPGSSSSTTGGLASLSGQGRHDLLEILDDRYARRGTLLASQVPLEHWHDVVGDPTFADAIPRPPPLNQGGQHQRRLINPYPAPLQDRRSAPRQASLRINGRLRPEQVDGFARNRWTTSSEYANDKAVTTRCSERGDKGCRRRGTPDRRRIPDDLLIRALQPSGPQHQFLASATSCARKRPPSFFRVLDPQAPGPLFEATLAPT